MTESNTVPQDSGFNSHAIKEDWPLRQEFRSIRQGPRFVHQVYNIRIPLSSGPGWEPESLECLPPESCEADAYCGRKAVPLVAEELGNAYNETEQNLLEGGRHLYAEMD